MQNFFNHTPAINYGLLDPAQWDYVKAGLNRNLDTIVSYYRNRVYTVKSNHFLARLITTINVPYNLSIERYHSIVEDKSDAISMAMKMTSSIYKGAIFEGIFYGNLNRDIIVTDNQYFNPFDAQKNWRNLKAVNVIKHNLSELDMLLPNGRQTSNSTGVNIISINIPMLAVQYRGFALEQERKVENILGIGHFIHMYVLPGMLETHIDLCIMNRFKNLLWAKPQSRSNRKHPFALVDYTAMVDKALIDIIKKLIVRNQEYYNTLQNIPAVVKDNMSEVLRLPENAQTRQYKWIEVIARIEELNVLAKIDSMYSGTMNRTINNELLRYFSFLANSQVLQSYLPIDIFQDTQYEINRFKELVNKN